MIRPDGGISSAAGSIAHIAIEVLSESTGRLLESLAIVGPTLKARTHRSIHHAAQAYAQNYVERYGFLRVLGKKEPVDLKSIYIPIYVGRELDIHQCESMDNLEKFYRQGQGRRFQFIYTNKQQSIQAVNQYQYLMVLGEPGAGKTTLLRQICLEALKGKKFGIIGKSAYIPVFIDLKELVVKKVKLENFIAEEFRKSGFPAPEKLTIKSLVKGKLLILLDGLNEVPEPSLNEVSDEIKAFVERYPKNRLIASCRTNSYRYNLNRFTNVAVAPWDDLQIEQFIKNWFKAVIKIQNTLAFHCWEALRMTENQAAKKLAANPLFLDFLCLVYERSQRFPKSSQLLYQQVWEILLQGGLADDNLLNPEQVVKFFSEVAFAGFEAEKLLFRERFLLAQAKKMIGNGEESPPNLDSNQIFDAIAIQPGILVELKQNSYSFYHPTLQEYLTAQYIENNGKIKQLVAAHLTDERWQPVFLHLAEKRGGVAGELLLQIEIKAQKYINTPKLRALLKWADRLTAGSEGNMKPAAKRAAALVISGGDFASARDVAEGDRYCGQDWALSSDLDLSMSRDRLFASHLAYLLGLDLGFILARARILASSLTGTLGLARTPVFADELTRELAGTVLKVRSRFLDLDLNFALDADRDLALDRTRDFAVVCILAREYEKLKISPDATQLRTGLEALQDRVPGNNAPLEVHRAFRDSLRQTCFNAVNLDPEMVNLSVSERESLGNYFYANCLMVQCGQAAGTSSTWEAIEERMLLVPDIE